MAASAGTVTLNLDANSVKMIRELQKAERSSRRTTEKIRADFNRMGRAVGVAATAIVAATGAIVRAQAKAIDELAKTADVLGVTTENLQALQLVAQLTGTSSQQLATNMERMQRRLGEVARGGGQAEKALKDVGVSIQDIVNLSADQQLDVLAKALAGVTNASIRASIANDLFGRDGVRMLKLMDQLAKDGIAGVRNEMEALGFTISRTQAAGVERMNDSMLKASLSGRGLAQQFTVGLAPAIAAIAEQFTQAAKESQGFAFTALDAGEAVGKALGFIIDAGVGVQRTFQVLGRALTVAFAGIESAVLQLADSMGNSLNRALDGLLRLADSIPGIDIEFRFGDAFPQLREQMDRAVGVMREGVADIQDLLLQPLPSTGIEERLQQIRLELENALRAGTEGGGFELGVLDIDISPAQKAISDLQRQVAEFNLDDIDRQLIRLAEMDGIDSQALADARQMLEWLRDSAQASEEFNQRQADIKATIEATLTPAERFVREIERLNDLRPDLSIETYTRAVIEAQERLTAATEDAQEKISELDEFAKQAARNLQSHFADFLFDPFDKGLKGMLRGFAETIRRMLAEAAAAQILGSLFPGGGLGGALGSFFGGARATGGPVEPNKAFLVGERGPELFVPGNSGNIVPNSAIGGTTVNVAIDARNNVDPAAILSLAPVISAQVEQAVFLKLDRGFR